MVLNKDRRRDGSAKKRENGHIDNQGQEGKENDKSKEKSKDKIRYQYDEHYFLTDPDEFIQEFWSKDKDWQLLEVPISLEEFEALPFVRSVFFHFGLRFDRTMPAVIETNDKGGADIRIRIPEKFEDDLVFYYQLRFADAERKLEATYRGANLERYVFQTVLDNISMFSIHVPTTGEYYLEIFANKIDESNKISLTGDETISPFRLKCACKFKIRCKSLKGKMHPLPDCASGEWGPKKALRHFGLKPIYADSSDTSSDTGSQSSDPGDNPKAGILNVEDTTTLRFKMPMPLQFVAKLKMNNVEQKALDPFVYHTVEKDILCVTVTLPQLGQFGLDLYAKPKSSDTKTLSHACKYLLNGTRVSNPVDLPKSDRSFARRGTIGPTSSFSDMGIKLLSHTDAQITLEENNHDVKIEIEAPEDIDISFHLLREPDEDAKEFVKMEGDSKDKKKVVFNVKLGKHGNYLLSIYACKSKGGDGSMPNVFNYVIAHKKKNPLLSAQAQDGSNLQVVFEDKKSSGLLKKSIFGSKKKEKEKEKKK